MEMLWSHKQLDSEQCLAILLNNSLDGNIDIAKSFLKKKGMKINREGLLGKAIEKGKVESQKIGISRHFTIKRN